MQIGKTRYTLGNLGMDYRFTGQRDDSYIKLLRYGSRRYDPELGAAGFGLMFYTTLGHKLRFFRKWKAQFVTEGIL
jgi:hypothetical protein